MVVEAVSSWRVQAAITEFGLTLEEEWSSAQREIFIEVAEAACKKLETRESIPAKEIAGWPLTDDLRIFPRSATDVQTAPIIELGRAIVALVSGSLPRSPKGEAWFYGTPAGRSTIRMEPSWNESEMTQTRTARMKYKVFFHRGTDLGLKTRVEKGQAWLDGAGLHIDGPDGFTISNSDILEAELFRLHGLGRVIRLDYRGGRVFLGVVRLMIGQFAFINFFKTGSLHKELDAIVKAQSVR